MTALASKTQLRMSFLRYAPPSPCRRLLLLAPFPGAWRAPAYGNPVRRSRQARDDAGGVGFGAVCTSLYILLAFSLALHPPRAGEARGPLSPCSSSSSCSPICGSPLFFAFHQVGLAFWTIVGISCSTLATALLFWRIRRAPPSFSCLISPGWPSRPGSPPTSAASTRAPSTCCRRSELRISRFRSRPLGHSWRTRKCFRKTVCSNEGRQGDERCRRHTAGMTREARAPFASVCASGSAGPSAWLPRRMRRLSKPSPSPPARKCGA